MFNLFRRLFTKNLKRIPLFWSDLDLNKYNNHVKKSAISHLHPLFKDDQYIQNTLNDVIDYIRDNYDMNKL